MKEITIRGKNLASVNHAQLTRELLAHPGVIAMLECAPEMTVQRRAGAEVVSSLVRVSAEDSVTEDEIAAVIGAHTPAMTDAEELAAAAETAEAERFRKLFTKHISKLDAEGKKALKDALK